MPKKVKVKQKVQAKKKGASTEKIDKNIRDVEIKPEVEKAIIKEVPKMTLITPNQIASKYNIRLSSAKKALELLAEKGKIKSVDSNKRTKLYTSVISE